ncbi:MAG: 16S rRNA (guanine(966)-N(2))-methyltransferase RsmD [Acholeplasmataceae bacterium]|nr:16S rRNA (guanine(966)-N(2))-methyltransferase RsmD [Acholeplasmataceae bacterium]
MRIVGGKHKGRKLFMVENETTRETADMVKEAVFNMLGTSVEGTVLDLFAGAGSYGFESLSRGATRVYFIDNDKHAIATIRKNADKINETSSSLIQQKDYKRFIQSLSSEEIFDFVFLDPPYEMDIYEQVIESLRDHVTHQGRIICESNKKTRLPDTCACFVKTKDKTYGIKRISIYEKRAE